MELYRPGSKHWQLERAALLRSRSVPRCGPIPANTPSRAFGISPQRLRAAERDSRLYDTFWQVERTAMLTTRMAPGTTFSTPVVPSYLQVRPVSINAISITVVPITAVTIR